jgi:hypothetical protein
MADGFNNAAAMGAGECNLTPFLASLSPGMGVVLQYDCQPPAFGVFQGFQGGFVILSDYNGYPGLVRIAACRINAVSPYSGCSNHGGYGGYGCGDGMKK